jgi:hypothetical protein
MFGGNDMSVKKLDKPNEGVKCVVISCEYYMNGDHCAAEKIQVEPRNASESDQTDCATFEAKDHAF